jgi:integration host factor subunit beta
MVHGRWANHQPSTINDQPLAISHQPFDGALMTNGSMTKAELVEEVSRVSDLTKKHSEVIVDTVFHSIIEALHRGEKIELRGFGSFRLRKREPRKGRNPKTGDKVDVPPKKVPYFKPGKELKELINKEIEPAPVAGSPAGGASLPPDALAV